MYSKSSICKNLNSVKSDLVRFIKLYQILFNKGNNSGSTSFYFKRRQEILLCYQRHISRSINEHLLEQYEFIQYNDFLGFIIRTNRDVAVHSYRIFMYAVDMKIQNNVHILLNLYNFDFTGQILHCDVSTVYFNILYLSNAMKTKFKIKYLLLIICLNPLCF